MTSLGDLIQASEQTQSRPMEQLETAQKYSEILRRTRLENQQRKLSLIQQKSPTTESASNNQHSSPPEQLTGIDIENQSRQIGQDVEQAQNENPFGNFDNQNAHNNNFNDDVDNNDQPVNGERWLDFIYEPSSRWRQRKANIFLNLVGALLIMCTTSSESCSIPLHMWNSIYAILQAVEQIESELRQRMSLSVFWDRHRNVRKIITVSQIILCEVAQFIWFIYGCSLYNSDESKPCNESDNTLMWLMSLFLTLGTLKLFLFVAVIIIVTVIIVLKKLKSHSDRNLGRQVIRSLNAFKYHALMDTQDEPDRECSICFVEYQDDDLVSKLNCNQQHIFHKDCLAQWISTGKNSCPICRAKIDDRIAL